ncbi:hypothetical protein KCP77_17975 [Salmonella enterica subsp. enterica]|nr:hypothetical protein KCP77_17975 [Salmonella enterica subsp. enterica]
MIIVSNTDFIAGFMMAKVDVKCPFARKRHPLKSMVGSAGLSGIYAVRHVAAAFRSTMNTTAPVSLCMRAGC